MSDENRGREPILNRYRPWFYAAAIYNLLWGSANILFPGLLFDLIGMPAPNYLALWQVVGMFVLATSLIHLVRSRNSGCFT